MRPSSETLEVRTRTPTRTRADGIVWKGQKGLVEPSTSTALRAEYEYEEGRLRALIRAGNVIPHQDNRGWIANKWQRLPLPWSRVVALAWNGLHPWT
jgi:hypothetical protein